MRQRMFTLALWSAAGLACLAACGSSKHSATSTPATAGTLAATTAAPFTPGASTLTPSVQVSTPEVPNPNFARQAIDVPAPSDVTQGTLTEVHQGEGDTGDYDRVVFVFTSGAPGYHIDYTTSVTGCASGAAVQVPGQAFLQVRMSPAAAHNQSATPTLQTPAPPGLPVLKGLVQTCDFEGVVTWVLGLSQQVDFRAFTVGGGILTVDVKHP